MRDFTLTTTDLSQNHYQISMERKSYLYCSIY